MKNNIEKIERIECPEYIIEELERLHYIVKNNESLDLANRAMTIIESIHRGLFAPTYHVVDQIFRDSEDI